MNSFEEPKDSEDRFPLFWPQNISIEISCDICVVEPLVNNLNIVGSSDILSLAVRGQNASGRLDLSKSCSHSRYRAYSEVIRVKVKVNFSLICSLSIAHVESGYTTGSSNLESLMWLCCLECMSHLTGFSWKSWVRRSFWLYKENSPHTFAICAMWNGHWSMMNMPCYQRQSVWCLYVITVVIVSAVTEPRGKTLSVKEHF